MQPSDYCRLSIIPMRQLAVALGPGPARATSSAAWAARLPVDHRAHLSPSSSSSSSPATASATATATAFLPGITVLSGLVLPVTRKNVPSPPVAARQTVTRPAEAKKFIRRPKLLVLQKEKKNCPAPSPPRQATFLSSVLSSPTAIAPSKNLTFPAIRLFTVRSLHSHNRPIFTSSSSHCSSPFPPSTTPVLPQSIMSEITHPTIKDGWFREISDMWPGQAMTLKVKNVIHHEKSKYQDVLIFESSDYGTVLVLDNVIQCTERDEFAYQEMITHLAMNSHPDPKKVLVIGGGDGGVLREVIKHDGIEEAILCDIDEAVIRLSKKYLPGMAIGFQHPKVKVHIGDGFKFLEEYKNEFDIIITDSSDPEGPAESLFQKPYFQLLFGALKEGGVITTQAENQWLHLPLITKLKKDCKEVFPTVEYAYTTIPTYPSGQIGFMVCCKDANRDVTKPLRSWAPEEEEKKCRYYNAKIHEASFILPTFARNALR